MPQKQTKFDAWNPGLTSEIPARLLPRVTLFSPENASLTHDEAREAAEFCGLKPQDMAVLKVSRLAVHEVLIRVTADLYVPDGPSYEELGLNLRSMAARILEGHVLPQLPQIEAAFAEIRDDAKAVITQRLATDIDARALREAPAAPSFLSRLLGGKRQSRAVASQEPPELLALAHWRQEIAEAPDTLETACLQGLITIVGGIVGRRGRLLADRDLVIRLTCDWVCNRYGSRQVGEMIQPILKTAAEAEGYRFLPIQQAPFVMNVKGASGAGKSTIRPLQRELAERIGIHWEDFALVSPDYWRKYLLDYGSLGDDFKYAAMLTGQELEIIDKKLDGYMEEKAARSEMPHLLIDRFRFDSFVSSTQAQADGRLLSRFGDTVFMFFIITPPEETVKRAWQRGIETGRYKAVDDLLYHNIEAYTGMPQLFFSWVNKDRQKVHFEFLDNAVPYGQRPRTAAFGWNGELTILDHACMRRLTRYTDINITARRPEDIYLAPSSPKRDILADCIAKIPSVRFADPDSCRILGKTYKGAITYQDKEFFDSIALEMPLGNPKAQESHPSASDDSTPQIDCAHEKRFTVGDWKCD